MFIQESAGVIVQSLSDAFWKRWAKEYLTNLETMQKWHSKTRNLKVNDIVILSNQCSRLDWHLGKVVKAAPQKDGLVRQVQILFDEMSGKHVNLVRPVTKLVLLVESLSMMISSAAIQAYNVNSLFSLFFHHFIYCIIL